MRTVRQLVLRLIIPGLVLQALLWSSARADDLVDFTLNDFVTKKQVSTTAFRGKCLLIIFGSIYCKPCIEILPIVRRLRDKYQQAGLVVIGIDIDITSEKEKIAQFIKHHEIRHLYLIDTIKVARQNRVFTLPTTLIVDPRGGIAKRFMGVHSFERLEREIKEILPECGGYAPYVKH